MKKTIILLSLLLATAGSTALLHSCKKDKNNSNNSSSDGPIALSIQSGARTLEPGNTQEYSAVFVDAKGATSPATGVTWSVSNSLGAFAGGLFTPSGTGSGTITASATANGKTLTAKVPVGVYLPALFSVLPSAIIWTTNAGNIPLLPVYLGTTPVSGYTYSSSSNAIASVSSTGEVTFNGVGECIITVTASGLSGNNKVYVPVLVVGMPTVSLPVARVTVSPGGKELFRNEEATFTAKAFNSSNAEVSGIFTWSSQDPSVATIDANGKVKALSLGKTIITATTSGITGQAEVDVLPDSMILVTPIMASIAPGGTKQFTAQAYKVNHSTRNLDPITIAGGFTWEVPTTGVPIFDIATVSSTGLVTMKSSATLGLSTVVIAHTSSPTVEGGAGLLMVSDCNCGTTTPGVTQITVTGGSTLNISMMGGPVTVNAQARDAGGNPVSGATITMCTDNMTVCNVDNTSNTIIPSGPGTAIITLCNGGVSTTITVNVTL